MKKESSNNAKITDYFNCKGITPLSRILNKPTLDSMTPRREKQTSTMSKIMNKSVVINE